MINRDWNSGHSSLQGYYSNVISKRTKISPFDRCITRVRQIHVCIQHALSSSEFVHARDPWSWWVPCRTLIICQLAHSRLRTRDTSIYRATNISFRVVFAKTVLDLFILGRSFCTPSSHRGEWFVILVLRHGISSRWCCHIYKVFL